MIQIALFVLQFSYSNRGQLQLQGLFAWIFFFFRLKQPFPICCHQGSFRRELPRTLICPYPLLLETSWRRVSGTALSRKPHCFPFARSTRLFLVLSNDSPGVVNPTSPGSLSFSDFYLAPPPPPLLPRSLFFFCLGVFGCLCVISFCVFF